MAFQCYEQRSLAATTTTSGTAFTTSNGQMSSSCLVVNYGTAGAQVAFGPVGVVALDTAAAGGSMQYYVPAGSQLVLWKGQYPNVAAVTDASTTNLVFHAGASVA